MAELNDHQEPTLPSKRKPDPNIQDLPTKAPKLASLDPQEPNLIPNDHDCSSESLLVPKEGGNDDSELQNDNDDEKELDEEEDEVDRKEKGVLRDDKGKGKLIEEEEKEEDDDDDDSDDDDSDDDGSVSGDDSDFSDDPLAEVDLNNILPSRTRRRTAHSGVHIARDMGNAGDDDDDSDDSDA